MNIYLFEFLAVVAVIAWAGALTWLISRDVVRWKHHRDERHGHHHPHA
ncbi:hypothetical protein [Mumia flava]|nr:hypothetical protein [Mumia flava]